MCDDQRMDPTLHDTEWTEPPDLTLGDLTLGDQPDLAIAHPSLLPADEPYLRIERTFIFLDLTGFTEYTREQGAERAATLLTQFRRATRSIASRRGVRVAKWMGDGAMLVGVEAGPSIALGAHLIAQFRNAGAKVRVGIATGVALLFEGDDYLGDPVNLAARLSRGGRARRGARGLRTH